MLLPSLFCAPLAAAAPLKSNASPSDLSLLARSLPILSDFDRDNKVDLATLSSAGRTKTISIKFGKSSWTALSFRSEALDTGTLVSEDIDHDGDIDLVWISPRADEFVLWLGDGGGNFELSKNSNAYVSRILSVLIGSGHEISAQSTESLPAILSSVSFLNVESFVYAPILPITSSSLTLATPGFASPLFTVLKLRGPPSHLF